MRARTMILVAVGAGLALYYGLGRSPAQIANVMPRDTTDDNALMLWKYPLDCPTTDVEPEIEMSFYVDDKSAGNRINFELSETHDFYVQSLKLEFWYMPDPDTTCETSPYCLPVHLDNYIKAGEVFEGCIELNDAEEQLLGGDMGTTDNWDGHILDYPQMKWCTANPELLRREETTKCLSRELR